VAILENSYDETRDVAVLTPERFTEYDVAWAKQSRSLMPRIPVRQLDLVVVEEMGKDVSGSGIDTNVIGFTRRLLATGQTAVPLAVLGLTEKTEGNAMGIGLADLTTRRLVETVDRQKTYTNVLATGSIPRAAFRLRSRMKRRSSIRSSASWNTRRRRGSSG